MGRLGAFPRIMGRLRVSTSAQPGVAVVGFDDSPRSRVTDPALSTELVVRSSS